MRYEARYIAVGNRVALLVVEYRRRYADFRIDLYESCLEIHDIDTLINAVLGIATRYGDPRKVAVIVTRYQVRVENVYVDRVGDAINEVLAAVSKAVRPDPTCYGERP